MGLPNRRFTLTRFLLLLVALSLIAFALIACSAEEPKGEAYDVATSSAFADKYAELRAQGKSHLAATELATIYVGGSVDDRYPGSRDQPPVSGSTDRFASNDSPGRDGPIAADVPYSMGAVVVLAQLSTADDQESERRRQAAEELKMRLAVRELDSDRALNLLNTMAPEASLSERRRAADRLALLSETEEWNERKALDAAEEVTRLITGDGLNVEKRAAAASELSRRAEAGDLDADSVANLVNDIAPELSVNKRREAADNLLRLSKTEDWNAEITKQVAESSFQLVTGGALDYEERRDAAIDLTGEGIKKLGGDSFDDRDVDVATEMIKSSFRGDLTTDKVSDLMGFDD